MQFQRPGIIIGGKIPSGRIRILRSPEDIHKVKKGDIAVVGYPLAEYAVIINRCAGIIANKGNDTCHLAIILRERNKPGWFGTGNASEILVDGSEFSLSGSHDTRQAGNTEIETIRQWEFSGKITHEMAKHMIDRALYDDG